MSCCCQSVYKFCEKISACDIQNMDVLFANVPEGEYTIELEFLNSLIKFAMVIGDGVSITGGTLNESYTYTGKLIDSDGEVVPLTVDEVQYDCFQFSTTIIN